MPEPPSVAGDQLTKRSLLESALAASDDGTLGSVVSFIACAVVVLLLPEASTTLAVIVTTPLLKALRLSCVLKAPLADGLTVGNDRL